MWGEQAVFCFILWPPQSFLAWKLASETLATGLVWIGYTIDILEEQIVDESSAQDREILTTYDDLRVTLVYQMQV